MIHVIVAQLAHNKEMEIRRDLNTHPEMNIIDWLVDMVIELRQRVRLPNLNSSWHSARLRRREACECG